jgi:phage terminase small subunit
MTPKQEKFCQLYVELGNASEAYRRSYDAASMSTASVNRKAKELLDNGKIAARLDKLRATHAERHAVTVDDIAQMLREDREFAREHAKPSACVAATMGLAKLYGHLTDKSEITGKGVADLIPTRTEDEARNMLADRLSEALSRFAAAKSKQPSIQ